MDCLRRSSQVALRLCGEEVRQKVKEEWDTVGTKRDWPLSKKSIQPTTEKCKFFCIHQNHQQINFKFPSSPLLFWGFRGPLYRKANIWTHFRQIWTNNKTTQNFFNIFLLQTVTVISNGRIEQITRYNCVFTHILIIVFCAFSPGKQVHLCFFSTMYNFQKFLLLISM